jgi:hypothetical protein
MQIDEANKRKERKDFFEEVKYFHQQHSTYLKILKIMKIILYHKKNKY